MASLIQDLQDLLTSERAQVEAVRLFEEDIDDLDPDIAGGLHDIEQSATWVCQGLYHRITQLGAIPTLETGDLPRRLLEKPDTEDRLKVLCSEQTTISRRIGEMMKSDEPDATTREFLEEARRLHRQAKDWCDSVLVQWKREAYLPP